MRPQLVELGELMPGRGVSVDPAKHPDEEFALFSVPAYDSQVPDRVKGRQIGSSKQVVHPGDVLLSKIVPHIRRAWIVPESDQRRKIGSSEWIIFRSPRFHGPYLRHLLISDQFNSKLMQTVSGVGGSLLRARPTGVAKIKVPLPSIEEQRRIAAMLDKAEELRAKRRAAIALLDQLLHAIFLEMFGDPTSNPNGWPNTTKLAEVSEPVSGITKGRKINGKAMREIPYLAVVNVQDRHLNLNTVKTIEATEEEIERYRLLPGDLLLTEGGDPDKLGRGSLWNGELPEAIHQNHIFRVRVTSPALTPLYLSWLIGSSYGKTYFLRQAKQTTGIATINMGQLKAFPLLLPPLELQHQFAARVEAIHGAKAAHQSVLANIDSLFASLQNRAFAGGLS
ncbi:MAG: restriction endonuclease subunit S [Nitrospira sp.]